MHLRAYAGEIRKASTIIVYLKAVFLLNTLFNGHFTKVGCLALLSCEWVFFLAGLARPVRSVDSTVDNWFSLTGSHYFSLIDSHASRTVWSSLIEKGQIISQRANLITTIETQVNCSGIHSGETAAIPAMRGPSRTAVWEKCVAVRTQQHSSLHEYQYDGQECLGCLFRESHAKQLNKRNSFMICVSLTAMRRATVFLSGRGKLWLPRKTSNSGLGTDI